MRSICLALFIVLGVLVPPATAATYPTCHLHKSRDVSFRDATSKDVLEVSIGTGPCYEATLTIVIRSHLGEVLYSYVAPFKRHIVTNWQDPSLDKDASEFVDEFVAKGLLSSSDLPPYLEPNPYYDEHNGYIKVSKKVYEQVRAKPRPMLYHLTYYEGWQYAVFDEATKASLIIVTGGL
jgi:hypothetical protein